MRSLIIALFLLGISFTTVHAQYGIKEDNKLQCSAIKSQGRTGTCWSFATTSFLESEIARIYGENVDLAEMFVVYNNYQNKARNYFLRQGKANLSEGSLAHDVLRESSVNGLVPQSAFEGKSPLEERYDHSELMALLKGIMDVVIKQRRPGNKWMKVIDGTLDAFLGEYPEKFDYNGKTYTAKSFANKYKINYNDYVNLTSFTHHPFGEEFILEIPDNYSNGSYLNVPLKDMKAAVDKALKNGYTVAWDGDVSEKSFSPKEGIAILPKDPTRKDLYTTPGPEVMVTQEDRQKSFFNYATTDDHLMHIVGTAKDKNGNNYYIIKNSWGEMGPYKGYLYMSEPYFLMKTVSVTLHKSALQ